MNCKTLKPSTMKNAFFYFLLILPFFAQGQATEATLLGHWHDETITPAFFDNPYHDVWGTLINGKEIGIISSTDGFHFFDLSGANPVAEPSAFIGATAIGSFISHRDFKVYQNYLYAVADEGPSALQIFDMSGLPDSVTQVYESNEFIVTCHNIFIDEDNARLYAVGGNGFTVRILSLADPENPTLMRSFPNADLAIPYVHDCYVRDNIAYLNAGSEGLWVVDFTDPNDPQLLGTMTSYPQQGYNHSGWLSDDGQYYYLCDETHGTDIKVVDVSDLSDIHVVATMDAESTPNQIVHNIIIQDDLLYASYYYDGLQVFDISNPLAPRQVAYYDTYDGPNTNYFAGAWGIYVLPSGRPLISDMNTGFYFFEPIEIPANISIIPSTDYFDICENETFSFSVLIGDDFNAMDLHLSTANLPAGVTVEFSNNTPAPGASVDVTISGSPASFFEFDLIASDNINQANTTIAVNVNPAPGEAILFVPINGSDDVSVSPSFAWTGDAGATSKRIEIATDEADFDNQIIFSTNVVASSYSLQMNLDELTTYYWRVITSNSCGDVSSPIFSFTTEGMVNTRELIEGNSFLIHPNPASASIQISFEAPLEENLQLSLFSINGGLLQQANMSSTSRSLLLPIEELAEGVYVLRLSSARNSISKRILVQR